ncbi:hypothetical protein ACGF4C_09550 [Streptomyces sp. NPDC048197]|uniref:hypothetical protein n=1 Tax=Streptomyces sp. NPDC048197 TaxID=3365511 RepID=UPI0037112F0F
MSTSATPGPNGPDRPNGPDGPDDLSSTERHEYERLRRASHVQHRKLRTACAAVLLVLAFLLAPLGAVAAWAQSQVSDADRYVQTVAPLAREPAIQSAVTTRLTNDVVKELDVKRVTDALAKELAQRNAPPVVVKQTRRLGGPLENAVTDVVHKVVYKVVTSEEFAKVWDAANLRAHAAVVKVLTGEGTSAIQARGDTVVLNIGTVVDKVQQRLIDRGFEKAKYIPDVDRQIVLLKTDKLQQAQNAMMVLDIVGVWLPVTVLVLVVLAVWTAPAHRATLLTAGVGLAVMMLLLLVGLAFARRQYLDSVPPSTQTQQAAAAIFDTLVRFLRNSTWTVFVVAVITAIAAYLYGPGRPARAVRSGTARTTGAAGRRLARIGVRTGGVGRWLDAHRAWTTGIVIAIGALVLVLWNYPTPASVALVLGIVLVVLVLLGVLAATGTPPSAAPPTPAPAGPRADDSPPEPGSRTDASPPEPPEPPEPPVRP